VNRDVAHAVRQARQALGEQPDAWADEHLRELVAGAELSIRMRPDALAGFLADGYFRGGSRPDGTRSFLQHDREQLERAAYREAPVYGYLSTPLETLLATDGELVPIDCFGPLKVVLDDRVRARATVTFGDSFLALMSGTAVPEPLDKPTTLACALTRPPDAWETIDPLPVPGVDTYAEVQIHGGLTVADIRRVDAGEPMPDGLSEALADIQVPVRDLTLPDSWRPFLVELFAGSPAHGSAFHGVRHWLAVATNAAELAEATEGANPYLAVLFALLHDAARTAEADEPEHGVVAGDLLHELEPLLPRPLSDDDHDLLLYALIHHDEGLIAPDEPTIGMCWDADRLDLVRVGRTLDPAYFSTAAGRERIGAPLEPAPLAYTLQRLEAKP
jgi:uncharacterized protein